MPYLHSGHVTIIKRNKKEEKGLLEEVFVVLDYLVLFTL